MRKLNKQLSQIRDKLLINCWEKNKADFTKKEVGSIFGLGETTTRVILNRRDNLRHIKKAYKRLLKGRQKITNHKIMTNQELQEKKTKAEKMIIEFKDQTAILLSDNPKNIYLGIVIEALEFFIENIETELKKETN